MGLGVAPNKMLLSVHVPFLKRLKFLDVSEYLEEEL